MLSELSQDPSQFNLFEHENSSLYIESGILNQMEIDSEQHLHFSDAHCKEYGQQLQSSQKSAKMIRTNIYKSGHSNKKQQINNSRLICNQDSDICTSFSYGITKKKRKSIKQIWTPVQKQKTDDLLTQQFDNSLKITEEKLHDDSCHDLQEGMQALNINK